MSSLAAPNLPGTPLESIHTGLTMTSSQTHLEEGNKQIKEGRRKHLLTKHKMEIMLFSLAVLGAFLVPLVLYFDKSYLKHTDVSKHFLLDDTDNGPNTNVAELEHDFDAALIPNLFPPKLTYTDCPHSQEMIMDKICHDQLNIAECGYDGGDCCLNNIDDEFCQECICHLTGVVHKPAPPLYGPQFAIDGLFYGRNGTGLFMTAFNQTDGWLHLQLVPPRVVYNVTVYNNMDCCDMPYDSLTVWLMQEMLEPEALCGNPASSYDRVVQFNCPQPKNAMFILLSMGHESTYQILVIDELLVNGQFLN